MTPATMPDQLSQLQSGASRSLMLYSPELAPALAALTETARRLNCRGDQSRQLCASCRQFQTGTQTQITMLTPETKASLGIEPIRQLIKQLALAPAKSQTTRMIIIHPADTLTAEAQNALLKTLEEPPSATIIVLVTNLPAKLLDTVQSRCGVITDLATAPSSNSPLHDTAQAMLENSRFTRLVTAKKLADGKTDLAALGLALHQICVSQAASWPVETLNRRLSALETFRRQLSASVTPRAALESLMLEL